MIFNATTIDRFLSSLTIAVHLAFSCQQKVTHNNQPPSAIAPTQPFVRRIFSVSCDHHHLNHIIHRSTYSNSHNTDDGDDGDTVPIIYTCNLHLTAPILIDLVQHHFVLDKAHHMSHDPYLSFRSPLSFQHKPAHNNQPPPAIETPQPTHTTRHHSYNASSPRRAIIIIIIPSTNSAAAIATTPSTMTITIPFPNH